MLESALQWHKGVNIWVNMCETETEQAALHRRGHLQQVCISGSDGAKDQAFCGRSCICADDLIVTQGLVLKLALRRNARHDTTSRTVPGVDRISARISLPAVASRVRPSAACVQECTVLLMAPGIIHYARSWAGTDTWVDSMLPAPGAGAAGALSSFAAPWLFFPRAKPA